MKPRMVLERGDRSSTRSCNPAGVPQQSTTKARATSLRSAADEVELCPTRSSKTLATTPTPRGRPPRATSGEQPDQAGGIVGGTPAARPAAGAGRALRGPGHPGCRRVGLALLAQDRTKAVVATDEFVREVDEIQHDLGQGPASRQRRNGITMA